MDGAARIVTRADALDGVPAALRLMACAFPQDLEEGEEVAFALKIPMRDAAECIAFAQFMERALETEAARERLAADRMHLDVRQLGVDLAEAQAAEKYREARGLAVSSLLASAMLLVLSYAVML